MANLKQGLTITGSFDLSTTTENTSSAGYLWFDGTNMKYSIFTAGAWSAGSALITGRYALGGAGTQNAGLAFGGCNPSNVLSCTEEYDGSSWSTGGDLITQRKEGGGFGTQNAAVFAGGYQFTECSCTEEYDGSSWTAGGVLINARKKPGTAGIATAGLIFGGEPHPSYSNCTEEYDGSSWSAGGALIQARYELGGAGTQNAALAHGGRNYFGGASPGPTTTYYSCTEEFNGTSWATGGALIVARHGLGGAGTQNAGIAFGGECTGETLVACTEEYDGTSWSAGGAIINSRKGVGSGGTQNQALTFGGGTPGHVSCTEEYNKAVGVCTL